MLSIIIPSRSPQYLQKTIDDLLLKAKDEVEIIVVFDGIWSPITPDKRVKIIHLGTQHDSLGMRACINAGMSLARGEYVMKIDEHCMVDEGYDVKLKADCEDNWLVVPRRLRLNAEAWELIEDGRPPIDYMYLAYPYKRLHDPTCGLYGEEWRQRHYDRKDVPIDDLMSFQGSCYFMKRKHWETLGDMDEENYGTFNHEAQEIGNKTWLSGGRVVVNKKTWYAHYHKGKNGKGYGFTNEQYRVFMGDKEKARVYCRDFWLKDKWDKRVRDWDFMINLFGPVPTWPENWKEQFIIDEKLNEEPTTTS